MTENPIQLGPWTKGQDTFHSPRHSIFLPNDNGSRVVSAINVDWRSSGWPTVRSGLTERLVAADGLTVFSGLGLLLVQDGGTIYSINTTTWATTSLVTGLDDTTRVEFLVHGNRCLWSNGIVKGQIYSNDTVGPWGLNTPPVASLTAIGSSGFSVGKYLVAVTLIDAKGVEHSANKSASITLSSEQSIQVGLSSYDSNAVYGKIYISDTNGEELYYKSTHAVGAFPVTLTGISDSYESLRTQSLSPPLPSTCLFSYRGSVMVGVENVVFPSLGEFHHLFELDEAHVYFPDTVLSGIGLDNGFWVISANAAYWTTGQVPQEYNTTLVDTNRKYAKGSITLPGTLFPTLGTSSSLAIFMSENGPMVGLEDGSIFPLLPDQLRLDVEDKYTSFAYIRTTVDEEEVNQLVWCLS